MVWLVVHLVSTAMLTGVAWVSLVVIYPAFALVGPAEWPAITSRTSGRSRG